jgi:hypothetical protein
LASAAHETLDRDDDVKPGSERGFGLVMAAAGTVIAAFQAWGGAWRWAAVWLAVAAAFAALALVRPALLAPLNRLWFRFGLLLHKVVSPLVMGLIFFAVVTPIGLLMRLLGQRPLALGFDKAAASYWTPRADGRPEPGAMRRQY